MPNGIPEYIHDAFERAERRTKRRVVGDLRQYINMDATRATVFDVLGGYVIEHDTEYNATFWEMAAETVFLAVGIRDSHKEPELSQEEIWNYVDNLAEFVNTAKCI
ncbi:hypothetical protein AB5J55_11640 [Streptomyces sp. R11]|uniref:Uncharacterized protein n=1 Tax=Streptomyces sp. R11 TaxID=3238625 RepID=A0AB39MYP5_9ACTN